MVTNAIFAALRTRLTAFAGRGLTRLWTAKSGAISGPVRGAGTTPKSDGSAQLPDISDRAKRWATVRHKDENNAQRRRVAAENRVALHQTLRRGR